jgi:hypothetical protein
MLSITDPDESFICALNLKSLFSSVFLEMKIISFESLLASCQISKMFEFCYCSHINDIKLLNNLKPLNHFFNSNFPRIQNPQSYHCYQTYRDHLHLSRPRIR